MRTPKLVFHLNSVNFYPFFIKLEERQECMLPGFSQPWNAGFRRNTKARSKNKKTLGNK